MLNSGVASTQIKHVRRDPAQRQSLGRKADSWLDSHGVSLLDPFGTDRELRSSRGCFLLLVWSNLRRCVRWPGCGDAEAVVGMILTAKGGLMAIATTVTVFR